MQHIGTIVGIMCRYSNVEQRMGKVWTIGVHSMT